MRGLASSGAHIRSQASIPYPSWGGGGGGGGGLFRFALIFLGGVASSGVLFLPHPPPPFPPPPPPPPGPRYESCSAVLPALVQKFSADKVLQLVEKCSGDSGYVAVPVWLFCFCAVRSSVFLQDLRRNPYAREALFSVLRCPFSNSFHCPTARLRECIRSAS